MAWFRTFCLAATIAAAASLAPSGRAQDTDKPKDEALDNLLEKLDPAKSPEGTKSVPKADAETGASDATEPRPEPAKETTGGAGTRPSQPSDEVAPKDKALDGLLEKLGETRETPAPDDPGKAPSGPAPHDEPSPPTPAEKPNPHEPRGREKDVDQHLEELMGKKSRKKDRQGDGNSPLSKLIKEMRDVEERLSKPDTGEETRKKQGEIVKSIETLIEQARMTSGQGKGKPQLRMEKQQGGNKPGPQQGSTPGAMAGGAPKAPPHKPTGDRAHVGGKDEWGHLPPELRQEMDNVFKEEGLPNKSELIKRYYLSLSRKARTRGE